MKKCKIVAIIILIFCIVTSTIQLACNKVYAGVSDGYSVKNDQDEYTVEFGSFGYHENVPVKIIFDKNMDSDISLPDEWKKIDSKTIEAEMGQFEYYIFSVQMEDDTTLMVNLLTPVILKVGEILSVPDDGFGSNVSISLVTSNSSVIAEETYNSVKAVGRGECAVDIRFKEKGSEEFDSFIETNALVIDDTTRIEAWDISLSKTKLRMEKDDVEDISVNMKLKEGYIASQVKEKIFSVNWSIEDETIAKLTSQDGEEMTNEGVAGSAKIEALKEGETNLIIVVNSVSGDTMKYTVPITVVSKTELPVFDISVDKSDLNISVGSGEEINVNAKVNGELANLDLLKDNLTIELKIEDNSIAKYTEKHDINSDGIVGSIYVEGLKKGTTNLIITVKVKDNDPINIAVPITVSEKSEPDKGSDNESKNDDSKYNNVIPQAGEKSIILITVGLAIISTIIAVRKIKKC